MYKHHISHTGVIGRLGVRGKRRGEDQENAITGYSGDPRVYRQERPVSKGGRAMTERKTFVRIRNLDDLQAVIDRHVAEVQLADPADTPAALEAVGFGLLATEALSGLLGSCEPSMSIAHYHVLAVVAGVLDALNPAPSLPRGIRNIHLEPTGAPEASWIQPLTAGVGDLIAGINALFPQIAAVAADDIDRSAIAEGAHLSAELPRCYDGLLRVPSAGDES